MENSEKIRLVSEFANVNTETAENFLRRTNWDVDEAVHAALTQIGNFSEMRVPLLAQSERATPRSSPEMGRSFFARLLIWLRQCFGWIGNLLFPKKISFMQRVQELHPEISGSEIFIDGPLRTTLTRTPPTAAILAIYSEISRDALIEAVIENFATRRNFRVHAISVDTTEGFELARSLRVRSLPIFFAVTTGNFSEIARSEISGLSSLLSAMGRHEAAQEGERQKISRDRELREEQDREFAALLAEEEKRKNVVKQISDHRQNALKRLQQQVAQEISDHTQISVKLKDGNRMSMKFPITAPVSLVYDWILAAPLMDEFKAHPSLAQLKPGNFYLSTTFPSRRLAADSAETLSHADLVPNALLVLTIDDDDHDDQ